MTKKLSYHQYMYNLYTKIIKILEICKQFSQNLVNEAGNIPRRGPVPKFSDLEVVALSLAAETESIDSEKWLFDYRLQEYKNNIPNLISRRQFNDRRIRLPWGTPQSKAWMDAYKGAGAFFTMQNLIRFHGCTAVNDRGRRLDKYQSLTFLSAKAEEYKNGEGWRLLAVLKKMLADNNINIKKKMAAWRKK